MANSLTENRKKVFITGASSALLQQVIELIDPNRYELVGLTRKPKNPKNSHIRWVIGDLMDSETYGSELTTTEIILHGAALTHSKNSAKYFTVNVEGTRQLLGSIPNDRNPLFVMISSRAAGADGGSYGESKLMAEELVKEKRANWIIIRPAEIFGGRKKEGIDNTILSAVSGGVQPCPVGLRSKLYPIHQIDAAKEIYEAVFEQNRKGEIVYVNGPKGYSYKELLKLIQAITNSGIVILPVPQLILAMAAWFSSLTGLNFGFVPDQVKRLYSEKKQGPPPKITIPLQDYIVDISREKG